MQTPLEARAEQRRNDIRKLLDLQANLESTEPEDIRYWAGQHDMVSGLIQIYQGELDVLEGRHRE